MKVSALTKGGNNDFSKGSDPTWILHFPSRSVLSDRVLQAVLQLRSVKNLNFEIKIILLALSN